MNDSARNSGTDSRAQQNPNQRQRDNTAYHESQLLGMLLKAPQQLDAARLIDPEDLDNREYRVMLDSLRDLALARNGITEDNRPDVIEMVAARTRRGEGEIAALVVALIEDCFSTANIADFATKVKRASLDRRIDDAMQGGDRRAVYNLMAEQDGIKERLKPAVLKSRFVRLSDMGDRPPAIDWLIEDYLERDTTAQLFGDPGCGKSFIALDMALSIAAGEAWYGHATTSYPVFYIAGEGLRGLQRRKEAWLRHHEITGRSAPFWLSKGATALLDPGQLAALIADIDAAIVDCGLPGLIVIDTVARNFGGGDENSTQDMTTFIAAIDALRERYHCCILLVHHTGHNDKSRARGSIALLGSLDAEYRVEKIGVDEKTVQLVSTRQKDNDDPPPRVWTLTRFDLPWCDAKGRPLNSAVLIPNDSVPFTKPVKEKMGNKPRRALEILQELYREGRRNLEEAGHDPETARVTVEDWHNAMQDISEDRSNRSRIRRALLDSGHVTIENGFVYLTK